MSVQNVASRAPAAAWDADLMKNAVCQSIDNGIDRVAPVGNALTKAGVSLCMDKTMGCTSEFVKGKFVPRVADNCAPAVNASVDSCKNSIVDNSKQSAFPLVDSCTETTSSLTKRVLHGLVNCTIDYSCVCYNRAVSVLYPQ